MKNLRISILCWQKANGKFHFAGKDCLQLDSSENDVFGRKEDIGVDYEEAR